MSGTIHDLGYQRYTGARRPTSARWRVIVRHQLTTAWRTWWRFKSAFGLAVIISFIAGGLLYLASDKLIRSLGSGSIAVTFADGVIPMAMTWYHRAAFLATLTITASVVAGDLQSGAFTLYFARSVRPRDYVLGKLGGLAILTAILTFAGPLLLAGLRLGLCESTEELVATLPVLGKVAILGAIATIVYTVVPLGFSALVTDRRYALAVWAAYYLVLGSMALLAGLVANHGLAALDLPSALERITLALFDVQFVRGKHADIPLATAIASLSIHVVVALGILGWRVRSVRTGGVGGSG
ncbi:MAG: hypothetical protein NT062_06230 [Proteobacteria bacterium]|nr:hypothetical protein [Pseudomonadota bacterium]